MQAHNARVLAFVVGNTRQPHKDPRATSLEICPSPSGVSSMLGVESSLQIIENDRDSGSIPG